MSLRQLVLEAIAVVAGAVIALLVVDLAAWIFADADIFEIIGSIGHLLVALVTVGLFAFFYQSMPPTPAAIASFFTGVGLPLILEKVAFGSDIRWETLIFIEVAFAIVALFTYRFVHANGAIRKAADDIAGSDRTGGYGP